MVARSKSFYKQFPRDGKHWLVCAGSDCAAHLRSAEKVICSAVWEVLPGAGCVIRPKCDGLRGRVG